MEMKDMEKRTAKIRRETEPLDRSGKIYVAGHRGLVGSALVRRLEKDGFTNLITRTHAELDLTRQADVEAFFEQEKPEYVILAAAKVGGIYANDTYPADFIMKNLQIECNVIDAAYKNQVKKLLFLGSSCIYPRDCPQPIKEEYLLMSVSFRGVPSGLEASSTISPVYPVTFFISSASSLMVTSLPYPTLKKSSPS